MRPVVEGFLVLVSMIFVGASAVSIGAIELLMRHGVDQKSAS
jgi:hypothetical protein